MLLLVLLPAAPIGQLFAHRVIWNRSSDIIDTLDATTGETGKTISQVAINWLLRNETVVNITVGAKNEQQLIENIGAVGWSFFLEQMQQLNEVSKQMLLYPYWVSEK